ncbi:DinB family protein [Cytobacillus suaedae]|nr:DinB family protein [Cytobacillus suaedae]
MRTLFEYNWQVRKDWIDWCRKQALEDLLRKRHGGMGSFLHTLIHIIDVEYSWIRALQGGADFELNFSEYETLDKMIELSSSLHIEVKHYLDRWNESMENEMVYVSWSDVPYRKGEILRHIIAHEIHHIGQLSVWARELGQKPVTANLIGRNLMPHK